MLKYRVHVTFAFVFGGITYLPGQRLMEYAAMQHARRYGYGRPISMMPIDESECVGVEARELPSISKSAHAVIKLHGINDSELAKIKGSGKGGTILKSDILNYIEGK